MARYERFLLWIVTGVALSLAIWAQPKWPWEKSLVVSPEEKLAIGVVNMERVRAESMPFRKLGEYVDSEMKSLYKEFSEKEVELRKELEEIRRLEASQSKSLDLKKRKDAFEKKRVQVEQFAQKKKDELDAYVKQVTAQIEERFGSILHELAQRHEAKILLSTEIILYAQDKMDLTQELIDEVAKHMADFKMELRQTQS